jgi:hypothetical protein
LKEVKKMTNLLDFVIEAHGGHENWKKVRGVDVRLSLRGKVCDIKKHPDGLRDVLVKIDPHGPRTVITPFPQRGSYGIFDGGTARIQTAAGEVIERLDAARASFEGHERATPWTDLQFLYFVGYAFWNYFTMPFLLSSQGVTCEEVEPWIENGQKWRVLSASFAPHIDTHCAQQRFYFDEKGLLQRHDYFTDVGRGNVAHYTYDHRTFDGFVFPTLRRVVPRDSEDRTALNSLSNFLIDIESVTISRD